MVNNQNNGGQEGKGRSFKNLKFNFPEKGFRPGLKAELKQQSTGMVSVKPLNKTSPEGERTMKRKTVFAILLLVGALVLTGWGCQKRVSPAPPEDAAVDTEIPAGWKEYRNEELGFEFWYPENLDVHVEIVNTDEAPEIPDSGNPWLLTKEELLEEQEEINNSPVGHDDSFQGDQATRSYYERIVTLTNTVKAKSYMGTSQGGRLLASRTFYHKNHRIEIWVSQELPESVYVNEVADNVLFNQLLEQIDQGRAPEEIQNFFDTFNQSMATFKLID